MLNILYFTEITEISLAPGLCQHICFGVRVFCPGVATPTLHTRQRESERSGVRAGPAGAAFLRALAARFVSFAARKKRK